MNESTRFLSFPRPTARRPRSLRRLSRLLTIWLAMASFYTISNAQVGGAWREEGPAPNTLGQVENIVPDDEVSGAVHTVIPHPTNANIMWIGAVNGGIWRTDNARATSPTWVEQTTNARSLSIGAMDLDPTDPSSNTLVAGSGLSSSFFGSGGDRVGILRTTNGGATWTATGALATSNITGVIARGNIVVASADFALPNLRESTGLFRSTDGGLSFTQISSFDNASTTGLPQTDVVDLVGDPRNNSRLFLSTKTAEGIRDGIFRSDDTGSTWTRVSNAEMEGILPPDARNIGLVEISVGQNNNVFVAIVVNGFLSGLFQSLNGGDTWRRMDTPPIHLGGQGNLHLSIAADPTNSNFVYLAGDRQDSPFPNAIGATDFSSTAHRCNAGVARGFQCVHLTHSNALGPAGGGTASSTSPHADSREMAFDADGNLIEADDGGIYKRTNPRSDQGDWFSMIGNLAVTELHDIAYDSNSNTIIGGAQDTGTPAQLTPGTRTWFSVATADGGDVAVDDTSSPGLAIRYSSFQNLGAFRRQTRDANNNLISQEFSPVTILSGPSLVVTFAQPYALNLVDPDRMILHAFSAAYESFDRGDSFSAISTAAIHTNRRPGSDPVAYGARNTPDIVYLSGTPDQVYVRTGGPGSAVVQSTSYPGTGTGRGVIDIAINPDNGNDAFVADDFRVYRTQNAGGSWTDLTGNLGSFDPGFLGSNVYIENDAGDALVVGADRGVFIAFQDSGFSAWQRLGSGLPNAPVMDLDYDFDDDILIAGLFGRGAFSLAQPLGTSGNTAPSVSISSPANNATFDLGSAVNFTGTANDAEDGNLTGNIVWTANGTTFGNGGSASTSSLAVGANTIVASVTDSGGRTGSATITVNVRFVPQGDGLSDDFETGGPGWTADGLWHLVSNSNCSPGFNSPVSAFYYGQDDGCTYETFGINAGNLLSPLITGVGSNSTLTFAFRRQVESFNGDFDRTIVEVSSDNGATFTPVLSLNATNASQNAWVQNPPISLAGFGPTIRVRFRFETVDASTNGFLGWMIDDVVVTADGGGGGDDPPSVNISAPANGSTFNEGQTITFSGTASDPEGGDLSGSIVWTSGGTTLGTGATINATLPVGTSTVTARVTDAASQSTTDSITVTVQEVQAGGCLFNAGFGSGTDDFIFVDDAEDPIYADGSAVAGALQMTVGGVDDADITNMQATWQRSCNSNVAQSVRVTVQGSLTQSQDYEAGEVSELRLVINGQATVLASFNGDGNGPPEQTTGLSTFTADVSLPAGTNTVAVACFNNLKTFNNEATSCSVDNVAVAPQVVVGACTNGVTLYEGRFESGADGWTTDPAQNCTTGTFVTGTPDAASNGGVTTQVAGAATGSGALFTQPNGGGVGTDDVDGGECSSLSPVINTGGFTNIEVSFNFFHGQRDAGDDAGDFFAVELSTDGGSTFTQGLETVLDATSNAAWTASTATIPATAAIRLRVRAADGTADTDLVEAGLDDVLVCGVN